MLRSASHHDKIGAMLAVNRIVKIGRETRIVHNIKMIIDDVLKQLSMCNRELVEMAAECLGTLAEAGGKNISEHIDQVPSMVIAFLREDKDPKSKEMKRYAAVLVIKEFCRKLSIVSFSKLFDTFTNIRYIFEALRDQREHVRETAAVCINECISLVNRREYNHQMKSDLAAYVYSEVHKGLNQESDLHYLQGVLSILCELVQMKAVSETKRGPNILSVSKSVMADIK
jgi:hypothetical protein